MPQIQIYDTTLRDGTQSEGFTLSSNDKVRIAQKLDELGVAFIEGGWPGSNPKDVEFFERARDMQWKNALIAAFGSTCRVKGGPEDDANIKALIDSHTPVCTIFGKTWTLHVKEVLLTTLEEFNILGVGTWPAAFNKGNAEFIQFLRNADLVIARKRKAFRLSPIAEGGVVDLDLWHK